MPNTIIQVDRPHPQSYRPDLPLRSELLPSEADRRYDEGYEAGKRRMEGRLDNAEAEVYAHEARVRTLEAENEALRDRLKKAS